MRVPLRAGRRLTRDDLIAKIQALYADAGSPLVREPVVVNEAFVKHYFANADPIGGTFCVAGMCGASRADASSREYWYAIVGVVADMHQQGLEHAAIP